MKLVTISGCMSSGKDSLLSEIIRLGSVDVKPVISHTSRKMRCNEVEGKEYFFVTKEEMLRKMRNGEFIETRSYDVAGGDTWYYGIHKSIIDINSSNVYIVIVDIKGLLEIKDYFSSIGQAANVTSIFVDCKSQIRLERALNREGSMNDMQVAEVCRRNLDDMEMVDKHKTVCDYIIVNEDRDDFKNNVKFIEMLCKSFIIKESLLNN